MPQEFATESPETENPTDTNNPDVLEALSSRYGNRTVLLIPLRSGNVAIFGRDFELHTILPDAPTREQLFRYSTDLNLKLFRKTKLDEENRFYGEPTPKQMVTDLKNSQKQPRVRVPKAPNPFQDIEPADLEF